VTVYYHYTKCKNFKGIINNKEIWLTNVNRPDDTLEATISFDEFISSLEPYSKKYECVNIIMNKLNKDLIDKLNNDLRNSQYAFSLTKSKDNKDHWEKYGENGKGICIGFDMEMMESMLTIGHSSY
jgi:hypothetical protein